MFINFWYPAERSSRLEGEPIKRKILGQNLVLYRDETGTARALSNICVHRCASLANGWTKNGRLVCPYHGWEYGADGRCQHIPSLGRGQPGTMARAQVDAYPVVERYGLVFVFLGDLPEEDRPPILEIQEWEAPGWRTTLTDYEWRANYRRVVENALDFAHPEFVHFVGRKGEDPDYHVPDYEVEEHQWGAGADVAFSQAAKGFWRYFRDRKSEIVAGTTFNGPNQFLTRIQFDAKMKSYQYAFQAPIDEYNVRTFLVNARNFFTLRIFDGLADRRNHMIVEEDRVIAEEIEPVIGQLGATDDLSVKADKIQHHYRDRLRQWEALGWRIDTEALAAAYPGKQVYVLPSPQRRTSKSWVFPTVPLVNSEEPGPSNPELNEG